MKRILRTALALGLLISLAIVGPMAAPSVAHGTCKRSASTIVRDGVNPLSSVATVSCTDVHYRLHVVGTFQRKVGNTWQYFGQAYFADCIGGVTRCSVNVFSDPCNVLPDPQKFRIQVDSFAVRTQSSGLAHVGTTYDAQATVPC